MDDPVSPKQPADAPPPPTEPQRKGRLTRKQVADRLGVSVSKVRTMEGKSLNPIKIEGVHYFERSDVDAAALSMGRKGAAHMTDGEVAAAVFKLIDNGKELREIVIELEQPPSIVPRPLPGVAGRLRRRRAAPATVRAGSEAGARGAGRPQARRSGHARLRAQHGRHPEATR